MSDAKSIPVNLPQREVLNQMQIDNLLRTLNTLTSVIAHTDIPSKEDAGDTCRYPEAAIAAENSLIIACERLDDLIKDNNRWDLSALTGAEQKLIELYEANTKLLQVRASVEGNADAPHMKYKPVLLRMGDGWAAIYGDPAFLDKALVGYGDTPEQAFKCFDLLFKGQAPEGLVAWLKQHTDYGKTTTTVDGGGDSGTKAVEEGGSLGDGNQQTPPPVG